MWMFLGEEKNLRVVGHIDGSGEILIQQFTNVRIEMRGGYVALILPRVVLEFKALIGVLEVQVRVVRIVCILEHVVFDFLIYKLRVVRVG